MTCVYQTDALLETSGLGYEQIERLQAYPG